MPEEIASTPAKPKLTAAYVIYAAQVALNKNMLQAAHFDGEAAHFDGEAVGCKYRSVKDGVQLVCIVGAALTNEMAKACDSQPDTSWQGVKSKFDTTQEDKLLINAMQKFHDRIHGLDAPATIKYAVLEVFLSSMWNSQKYSALAEAEVLYNQIQPLNN